jgi:UrcA family protein
MEIAAMSAANRFISLIATALFGVLSSSFALRATADSLEPLKETVKFGDLDISHPKGAAVLYTRIRMAAEKVCSPYDRSGLSAKTILNACIDKAVVDAVATVNEPALLAIYRAKRGGFVPPRLASLQNH